MLFAKEVIFVLSKFTSCTSLKKLLIANGENPEAIYFQHLLLRPLLIYHSMVQATEYTELYWRKLTPKYTLLQ